MIDHIERADVGNAETYNIYIHTYCMYVRHCMHAKKAIIENSGGKGL